MTPFFLRCLLKFYPRLALSKLMKFDYFKFMLPQRSDFFGGSVDISEKSYGILGQRGFFDIFTVKFDLTKEEIELNPKQI